MIQIFPTVYDFVVKKLLNSVFDFLTYFSRKQTSSHIDHYET